MAAAYGERGRERRVLAGVALVDRAVDLVGRDLEEARSAGRDQARVEQDMDADDPGREERLRIEDRAIDVRFGGEVDDPVDRRDERRDDGRIGDVAAHEAETGGHLRIVADRGEVGLVAGIGQLVEDRDPGPVAAGQDIADVARPDEPGAAGHEEVAEGPAVVGRVRHAQLATRLTGGESRPAASSAAASSAARSSDGTVPASVQWPS